MKMAELVTQTALAISLGSNVWLGLQLVELGSSSRPVTSLPYPAGTFLTEGETVPTLHGLDETGQAVEVRFAGSGTDTIVYAVAPQCPSMYICLTCGCPPHVVASLPVS